MFVQTYTYCLNMQINVYRIIKCTDLLVMCEPTRAILSAKFINSNESHVLLILALASK